MRERLKRISRLRESDSSRISYIKSKLSVLIPSQIKALRLKSGMARQEDLAVAADMKQSRISAMETPGAVNFNLETLVRLASAFKVGLIVKFVPFSEMLRWENSFKQDEFNVIRIDDDIELLAPIDPRKHAEQESEADQALKQQNIVKHNNKTENIIPVRRSALQEIEVSKRTKLHSIAGQSVDGKWGMHVFELTDKITSLVTEWRY